MGAGLQPSQPSGGTSHPFRLDVQLHELLTKPALRPVQHPPAAAPHKLPNPVFPRHPELLTDQSLALDDHGSAADPYKRKWTAPLVYRAMRGWLFPYLKSRMLPGDFHPIIAYLFTEWKCNLDCHYGTAYSHRIPPVGLMCLSPRRRSELVALVLPFVRR